MSSTIDFSATATATIPVPPTGALAQGTQVATDDKPTLVSQGAGLATQALGVASKALVDGVNDVHALTEKNPMILRILGTSTGVSLIALVICRVILISSASDSIGNLASFVINLMAGVLLILLEVETSSDWLHEARENVAYYTRGLTTLWGRGFLLLLLGTMTLNTARAAEGWLEFGNLFTYVVGVYTAFVGIIYIVTWWRRSQPQESSDLAV